MVCDDLDRVSQFTGRNITGYRFGRLKVLKYAGKNYRGNAFWTCQCDCGNTTTVMGQSLKSGGSKSCGCSAHEWAKGMAEKYSVTHGLTRVGKWHELYGIFAAMKRRCYNSKTKEYYRYGGRGIKVCDAWNSSFECFLKDMGERPTSKHSIERINNSGDYEPGNCRWATSKEQARNRTSSRFLTYNGKSATIAEWSEITGISPRKIRQRICREKWTVERALTTP